jgi:hypothetical protein
LISYDQMPEATICHKQHDLTDLRSIVECAISQVDKLFSIGKVESVSIKHRILFSNFQQLEFGADRFSALPLMNQSAFDGTFTPGTAWFISLGSFLDQLLVEQTIGPIKELSDLTHLQFRRSLFRRSDYCFVTHSLQEFTEFDQVHFQVEGESNHASFFQSFLGQDMSNSISRKSSFDESLESKYWNTRYELDQTLIELGATYIERENYKLLYRQSVEKTSKILDSKSWRITRLPRFINRKFKFIKRHAGRN